MTTSGAGRAPRRSPGRWTLAILLGLLGGSACGPAGAEGLQAAAPPLSPEQALASFALEAGYRIEIAAAEPLIRSPIAIAFDERGRMYVVENRGYPDPLEGAPRAAPQGEIALLEDRDGDGRFDRRTAFATELADPNGIMPWDGGVFVTAAPDLLYLKDTDGDDVADERRVILTGFDRSRTAQIRFSHPTLGFDNWIYLTSGLAGGNVHAPAHPARPPVTFARSDSRVHPVTHAFELTGGQGQFGLTFDDHGRRFICANRNPAWHVVLEPWHLKRNPHLPFSDTVHEVSASGAAAPVWPLTADLTTASFHPGLLSTPHAGTFTSASGLHIHRGDAVPPGHAGSLFICESAQNLVQRQVRSAEGVSFTSRAATPGQDFLASRDSWFRPVFAANGPDGALYIVDMYRRFIDHPQYVPADSRALLDFESGKDRGRIYRIAAREENARRQQPDLHSRTAPELVRALEHPNGWWRDTAQRLLVERRDDRAVPHVRQMAARGRGETARIHALWTLEGLAALEAGDVAAALRDPHAAVRENALQLAGTHLETSPGLLAHVIELTADPDARVRLHAALALGGTNDARAIDALAAMARRDGADRWMRAAILSSMGERAVEFLRAFGASPMSGPVRGAVMQDLGQIFGAGQAPERCLELILEITEPGDDSGWQPAALAGLAEGLRARAGGGPDRPALTSLLAGDSPRARAARRRVEDLFERAGELASDPNAPADLRLGAIGLLAHGEYDAGGGALAAVLAPQHPVDIQLAAVRALSRLPGAAAARALVDPRRWAGYTPRVRESVLTALAGGEHTAAVLLDAVEAGTITPGALGPSRRTRLTAHRDAAIQARARALLTAADPLDRMQVYERTRASLSSLTGKPSRGQSLFAAHCSTCHRFDGRGGQLGPDLSGIRNQPADAILLHALVPDYEITPGYQAYTVETRDGRTLFGRLESETPTSVTLRDAASHPHQILRTHIVSMEASRRSLMQNEIERAMSVQDLADLIAFLKER